MRVLVCGGRHYGRVAPDTPREMLFTERQRANKEASLLNAVLSTLYVDGILTEVVHGGAPGADEIADYWARRNAIPCTVFKAEWGKHGKAAGPIRNSKMLAEGKPGLVVSAKGGTGTADMVAKARAAGVEVMEVE